MSYGRCEYGAYVDPALLLPRRSRDFLPPVVQDISSNQLLWGASSDTLDDPSTTTWLDHSDPTWHDDDDPTLIETAHISSSTEEGQRRPRHSSARKRKGEVDVAETPTSTRPEVDGARKLSTRERNRIAAYRSRLKRSKDVEHLEEEERLVSIKRDRLSAYVASLRSEAFELQNMLLAHRECDCVAIRKYFKVRKGIDWSDDVAVASNGGSSD